MPALSTNEAAERLAKSVENAKPTALAEIYAELFPEKSAAPPITAVDLAKHIREGLETEEIVDLWNVVFPEDHNVFYDEEEGTIRFNEEVVRYTEAE